MANYDKWLNAYSKFKDPLQDDYIDAQLNTGVSKDTSRSDRYTPTGEYSTVPKDKTVRDYNKTGNPYSDYYKSKRNYEARNGNVVSRYGYGDLGTKQYKDPKKYDDTSFLMRGANWLDDTYDDVTDALFGTTTPKTKKEKQESKDDNNIETHWGKRVTTKNKIFNEEDVSSITNKILNAEEDPDSRDVLYYARIDNKDGTVAYKLGTASTSTFERTKRDPSRNDITYLWVKRTDDAKELEALVHGNKTMLGKRRSDLGYDTEQYGSGYTEIYNEDFLNMDGTVSAEKLKYLNESASSGLKEFGVDAKDRYDFANLDLAEKELEKTGRIYGVNSDEYQGLKYSLEAKKQEHRLKKLGVVGKVTDLGSGVASSTQQLLAGLGDVVLDAVDYTGNNTLLDNLKSAESADESWGYASRKEISLLGHDSVKTWDDGDYVGALMKGIQAAPDTLVQSLPDMALMLVGGAGVLAKGATLAERAVAFGNLAENKGLTAFAAKQTNNQIDERRANGEDDTNLAKIGGMFATNYALAGLDRMVFKGTVMDAVSFVPKSSMGKVATKFANIVGGSTLAAVTESGQEYLQSLGEAINAGLGTERFGDEFFNKAFTQQAKEGAILGFGAGGTMHATLASTGTLIKAKNEADRVKKVKEHKIFDSDDDVTDSVKEASVFNDDNEIADILDSGGVKDKATFMSTVTGIVKAIDSDNTKEVSTLVSGMLRVGIAKGYITQVDADNVERSVFDSSQTFASTLSSALNKSNNNLKRTADKQLFFNSLISVGDKLNEVVDDIESTISRGFLDATEVSDFLISELNSNTDAKVREVVGLVAESMGITATESSTFIHNTDKQEDAIDAVAEQVANDIENNADNVDLNSIDLDDFDFSLGTILSSLSNGANVNDVVQKITAILDKVSDKVNIDSDVFITMVADYISRITTIDVVNDNNVITDKLSGIDNFASVYNTVKAFRGLKKEAIEAILKQQATLIGYANLTSNYDTSKDNKSVEDVMYDVVIGNGSYGKKSLSSYLHRFISTLAMEDVSTKNAVLTKLRNDLAYWVTTSHKEISTGKTTDGVTIKTKYLLEQKELEFDLKLGLLNTFDTVMGINSTEDFKADEEEDINEEEDENPIDTSSVTNTTRKKLRKIKKDKKDITSKLTEPILKLGGTGLNALKLPKVLADVSKLLAYKGFINSVLHPIRLMFNAKIEVSEDIATSIPHIVAVLVDNKIPVELLNASIFATATTIAKNVNGLEGTDTNYDILRSVGLDEEKRRITKSEYNAVRNKGISRNMLITAIAKGIEKHITMESNERQVNITLTDGTVKTVTLDASKDFKKALAEELAVMVVGNLVMTNMLVTSIADVNKLKIPFVKFKPNAMYKNIKGGRELIKNLKVFSSVFKEDAEIDGYIADVEDLPSLQKTSKSGDKLTKSRRGIMKRMRETPYFVNSHLKNLSKFTPLKLF